MSQELISKIDKLSRHAKLEIDYGCYVREAFLLGLWHEAFPPYVLAEVEFGRVWNLENLTENKQLFFDYEELYPNLLHFAFISDTGDSWHQCYRDLRNCGWQRRKVHRDKGLLKYLFQIKDEYRPRGFNEVWLVLEISIATCKQVQTGTQLIETPIFETQCEDLIRDLEETAAEVTPLVVIPDIETVIEPPTNFAEDYQIPGAFDKDKIPF